MNYNASRQMDKSLILFEKKGIFSVFVWEVRADRLLLMVKNTRLIFN